MIVFIRFPSPLSLFLLRRVIQTSTAASTSLAVPRKRVLGDVTNATKNKSTSTTNLGKQSMDSTSAFVKPAFAPKLPTTSTIAPTTNHVRRTIRTRSSTGGHIEEDDDEALRAIQDDSSNQGGEQELDEDAGEIKEEEVDENAMVIDEPRPIRAIKRSARAPAAAVEVATVSSTTTATTTRGGRVPLASRTTNRSLTTSAAVSRLGATKKATATATKVVSDVTLARQKRLAAARLAAELAEAELEAALKEEEEAHAAKRPKTTSDDVAEVDEGDEEIEEMESKVRRKDALVNGLGMKDEGWIDLDDGDEDDPLMVSSYVVEVYEYMRELEVCFSRSVFGSSLTILIMI
jgi:hypothetical protein